MHCIVRNAESQIILVSKTGKKWVAEYGLSKEWLGRRYTQSVRHNPISNANGVCAMAIYGVLRKYDEGYAMQDATDS